MPDRALEGGTAVEVAGEVGRGGLAGLVQPAGQPPEQPGPLVELPGGHRHRPVRIVGAQAGGEAGRVAAAGVTGHRVASGSGSAPKPAHPAVPWARVCVSPARLVGPAVAAAWWARMAARSPSANRPAVPARPSA